MKLGTCVITNKSARICLYIFGDTVIQSLKSGKKTRKSSLVPMLRQENLRIYSWYSLPDLKHDQKRFIPIPSSNFPEMRPSKGTFSSILSNGYHGNDDRYKNFDFSFRDVFSGSVTIQSFITINWQEKMSSIIKMFKFFVSNDLKLRN